MKRCQYLWPSSLILRNVRGWTRDDWMHRPAPSGTGIVVPPRRCPRRPFSRASDPPQRLLRPPQVHLHRQSQAAHLQAAPERLLPRPLRHSSYEHEASGASARKPTSKASPPTRSTPSPSHGHEWHLSAMCIPNEVDQPSRSKMFMCSQSHARGHGALRRRRGSMTFFARTTLRRQGNESRC